MGNLQQNKRPAHLNPGGLGPGEPHISVALRSANLVMWTYCPTTGALWLSENWYEQLGFESGAIQPSKAAIIRAIHPKDRRPALQALGAFLKGSTQDFRADFRFRSPKGVWLWLACSAALCDRSEEGLPSIVCGVQVDISERKRIEEAQAHATRQAEESNERISVLADNSPAALFEYRVDAAGKASFPYLTSGVLKLLNVPASEVDEDGNNIFRNLPAEDQQRVADVIYASMQDMSQVYVRYRVNLPSGNQRWIQANARPKATGQNEITWFGSIYDVTQEVEREQQLADARDAALALEQKMRQLALLDSLTGLPNRRRLDLHLQSRGDCEQQLDTGPSAVLIRVDLDRFKNVNDTLGHGAGDAVLCHVAKILQNSVGASGVAARTGGDEFSIVLAPGQTVDHAKSVVSTIQIDLADPFMFEGKVCRFGASFGIASTDIGTIDSGDLMSFADAALYRAKQRGRNRMEVFDTALHKEIIDARRLASDIEAALDNNEFVPYFHPQVCTQTGDIVGLEVLARWISPRYGQVSPDRFLPVAEQIRVVPLIDKAMIDQTADLLEAWKSKGFHPPKLGFNVSADRLRDDDIISATTPFKETGVTVAFELLESILLEEQDDIVKQNLDRIKESGIRLEVDDFGTGHASILGLLEVRPDILKIDKRLSLDVETDPVAYELIQSVVGIARAIGVKTTVEGVETQSQLTLLRDLGCDQAQGYLLTKPLPAQDLLEWVLGYQQTQTLKSA